MHQRSCAVEVQGQHGAGLGKRSDMTSVMVTHTTTMVHTPNASNTKHSQCITSSKRLLLWLVLVLQFCFIVCFWMLQLGVSGDVNDGNKSGQLNTRVNFLTFLTNNRNNNTKKKSNEPQNRKYIWQSRTRHFQRDFILHKRTLNSTEPELAMEPQIYLWCYREGTRNESLLNDSVEEDAQLGDHHCNCRPEWHGRDCGQPEVIWRALMTAKTNIVLRDPIRDEAHRLVYMIEGHFHSLDMLELQLKTVDMVVDYFIIYLKRNKTNLEMLKALKQRLKLTLTAGNYLLYHCTTRPQQNCSAAAAYHLFNRRTRNNGNTIIKPTDLFVYSDDSTLLARRALAFLKYYAMDIHLFRFRLKFNVYGFYWQHPTRTHQNGVISSFALLDNAKDGAQANPALLNAPNSNQQGRSFVIGDLNHFGGWFCKYCQQPEEIIAELHQNTQSSSSSTLNSTRNTVQFPPNAKQQYIDVSYLQHLISTGVYVDDGKTQLIKVRRYSNKYYAPEYASRENWKYGHLLVNIYETLDELVGEEDEMEIF